MRIKILYLLPTLGYGGTTRIATSFALRAARFGFLLKFVLINPGPLAELLPNDIGILILRGKSKLANIFPSSLNALALLTRLMRILKAEKPDVVIADVTTMAGLSVLASMLLGKPFLLLLRMGNIKSRSLAGHKNLVAFFERFIVRSLFPRADHILVPTKCVAEDLIDNFGIHRDKIVIIPNPLELQIIASESAVAESNEATKPRQPTFVFVGRLSKRKGVNYLIEAFAIVAKSKSDVQLHIIGDGPEREKLQALAKNLGIHNQVHFLGTTNNPYKHLRQAVAYVHPALWDGFGYAVAEAMACGIPPIVFADSGGPSEISEIVENGKNGVVVPYCNTQALAEAMLLLLENKQLRTQLSIEAAKKAQEWNADVVISQYARFICDVVKKRRR